MIPTTREAIASPSVFGPDHCGATGWPCGSAGGRGTKGGGVGADPGQAGFDGGAGGGAAAVGAGAHGEAGGAGGAGGTGGRTPGLIGLPHGSRGTLLSPESLMWNPRLPGPCRAEAQGESADDGPGQNEVRDGRNGGLLRQHRRGSQHDEAEIADDLDT
jgi:hypothetical protein